jgi:hypothetical protein
MGAVTKFIESRLPGVFIHSINTASDRESDKKASFFGIINDQVIYIYTLIYTLFITLTLLLIMATYLDR